MMVDMSNVSVIAAVEALDTADLAAADTAVCIDLLRDVRRTRGWLDAVEARISSRMRDLSTITPGSAGPAATAVADLHGAVGGVSAAEGRRKERRSKTLDDAPSFADALETGKIGAEHVDALANATAGLDDDLNNELLGQQESLLAAATSKTPEEFSRLCRDRIRRLERDHVIERNRQQRNDTYLTRKINRATGMTEGRYAFHPELANQIFTAIDREIAAIIAAGERARDPEFVSRSYDRNRLAAEALGRLVAGGHDRERPLEADITYIVDAQTAATARLHDHSICETGDGIPVPPDSVRRAVCNGFITPVIPGTDGVPINVGRTHRTATRAQRRALRSIYRSCAYHGCDVAFDRCEIHHIDRFEHGGATDLHNLLPLCSRHHHLVHEGGWTIQLSPERTLTITRPDGQHHATTRPDILTERDEPDDDRERQRRTAA
jgi:hypothetical protein